MKIFRFFETAKINSPRFALSRPAVVTIPDTALLIQKRPFFIPDFAEKCTAQCCLAVRISRLGRSIHPRFAARYYRPQGVTLGVHFVAENLLNQLQSDGLPWELAVGFDNAVAVADESPKTLAQSQTANLAVNESRYSVEIPVDWAAQVDAQIAHISLFYTLRQGDLLLFPLPLPSVEVHIDDRLALSLDGEEQLAFNIK